MTIQEFRKLSLSDAILQTIEDVKDLKAQGVVIDMSGWVQKDTNNEVCAVCFAGACLVSRHPKGIHMGKMAPKDIAEELEGQDAWTDIKIALNGIRSGHMDRAVYGWYGDQKHLTSPIETNSYRGIIVRGNYTDMLADFVRIAKELKKQGL